VKALLDVNVLVAHAVQEHEHHSRVCRWVTRLPARARLHTCPFTEAGFLRVVMALSGISFGDARQLLAWEKDELKTAFIPADLEAGELPEWVRGHKQVTDAYLFALSQAHQLSFVTLDKKIPGITAI
jgi:predicted nucleic acid-binding protein